MSVYAVKMIDPAGGEEGDGVTRRRGDRGGAIYKIHWSAVIFHFSFSIFLEVHRLWLHRLSHGSLNGN